MKKYIFFVAVLATNISFAQEKEKNIEEVNILARKKIVQERKEFLRHGQTVENLDETELKRNNPAQIEQSLSTLSGVQVDKRTNLGGQRFVIRGYGNDQKFNNWGVKVYWNNMPLTNADGVTILDDVDFSYINNIEVVKGPAATMYGAGVGGVVRLYTKEDFTKGTYISQNTMMGSFKHFQMLTQVNTSDNNFAFNLNYGHLQTDGYRPNGSGLKNFVNVNGSIKINDKQKITLLASQAYSYEKVSGQIPYAEYLKGNDEGNTAYMRKNAGNKINSTRVGLGHVWDITTFLKNYTTLFYSASSFDRIAAGAFETSTNPNVGFRTTFQLNKDWGTFFQQVDFGAEVQNSKSQISNYRFTGSITNPLEVSPISKGSYFRYDNNQSNYFFINRFTYKPWGLALLTGVSVNNMNYSRKDLLALPGLLIYNGTDNYNKDLSFDKKYKTAVTPHVALQKIWGKQIFNVSYSEGYNAPTAPISVNSILGPNFVNDKLTAEKAKMWEFSTQGLLLNTHLDYQISVFNINVSDKLTQVVGKDNNANNYTYWENTGNQKNKGLELSVGYNYNSNGFINRIVPFINYSWYDFRYDDFYNNDKTVNYSGKEVVGVPKNKYAIGLDFYTKMGFYLNNTYNYLGDVYSDFGNTRLIKGFGLLNSKIGYEKSFGKWKLDAFFAGNNLTNQINYTFLFLGYNANDSDKNSNYPGQYTDVNPGYKKAYYFYGLNLKYRF